MLFRDKIYVTLDPGAARDPGQLTECVIQQLQKQGKQVARRKARSGMSIISVDGEDYGIQPVSVDPGLSEHKAILVNLGMSYQL